MVELHVGTTSRSGTFAACPTRNWGWVSGLCPGFVATDINTSERNRPESAAPGALDERSAEDEMRRKFLDEVVAAGMRPEAVADLVHDAVCNDRFWIFTDLNMVTVLADKHDSIMQNRNPAPPMLF